MGERENGGMGDPGAPTRPLVQVSLVGKENAPEPADRFQRAVNLGRPAVLLSANELLRLREDAEVRVHRLEVGRLRR